jgi:hypothetical protein
VLRCIGKEKNDGSTTWYNPSIRKESGVSQGEDNALNRPHDSFETFVGTCTVTVQCEPMQVIAATQKEAERKLRERAGTAVAALVKGAGYISRVPSYYGWSVDQARIKAIKVVGGDNDR